MSADVGQHRVAPVQRTEANVEAMTTDAFRRNQTTSAPSAVRHEAMVGNGDKAKIADLPVSVNLSPENVLPLLAVVIGGQPFLTSSRREAPGSVPTKLSIAMCAFNEERTIARAINEVLATDYPCEMELIVVDDGSTDATPTLLAQIKDPRVIIHRHSHNKGKGAALLSAASLANGTHLLPFDADLEYSADDIEHLIRPVLKGRCDVVYGVRIFGFNTVYRSYRYAAGNRLLTLMANLLFNAWLSDLHTCMKLMPLELFRSFNLKESGFGLDTEVTALLLKAGVRPFEVPVSYYSRTHDDGKKITWRDAVACMSILLRVRLLRSSRPKAITASRENAHKVSVTPESAGPGWGAVRALGVRDDGQPNAAVTS
jgi:dolichol-phosphate hexosyltransferase